MLTPAVTSLVTDRSVHIHEVKKHCRKKKHKPIKDTTQWNSGNKANIARQHSIY